MRLCWLLIGLLGWAMLSRCEDMDMNAMFDDDEDDDGFGQMDLDAMAGGGFGPGGDMPFDMDPEEIAAETELITQDYKPPSTSGLLFAETFDAPLEDAWVKSAGEKFQGTWLHRGRQREVFVGDKGLEIEHEARHVAISRKIPLVTPDGGDLIIHYEVHAQEGLTCGGAYMKLFDSEGKSLEQFTNETPYTIMFGPDKCGSTNKVHVIFRTKNPITGEWSEHHLKNPPSMPTAPVTHSYTLVVKTDDTVELIVDDKPAATANMHTDFEPSFTPREEIEDPEDIKPEDWVTEKTIPDPSMEKPEDWDEAAPPKIPDPEDEMPAGWLVDELAVIPDPEAVQPEDWNEEVLGEWTAPNIKNPKCTIGCGPYSTKMMPNPAFKGKWVHPTIPNPEYKGEWAPKTIPNPGYFENKHPHVLGAPIDAVGFELWTMTKSILFDNIVVARSLPALDAFLEQTWVIRHQLEEASNLASKKKGETANQQTTSGNSYLTDFRFVGFGFVSIVAMSLLAWRCFIAPGMKKPSTEKSEKKESEKKDDEKPAEEEKDEKKETEAKEGQPRRRKGGKD